MAFAYSLTLFFPEMSDSGRALLTCEINHVLNMKKISGFVLNLEKDQKCIGQPPK